MRIVAGSARGRVLATPKKADVIRPTADRVRESLFNVLGQWCDGLAVLDVFAGTGALALEALSRGAARAVLVDSGREAQALCRQNAESLGFGAQIELLAQPWERALGALAQRGERFDLLFADPPYALQVGAAFLSQIDALGLLAEGGRCVFEHTVAETLGDRVGSLARVDERRFGDTAITLFQRG